MRRVDLHAHSTASDGTLSPRDLAFLGSRHGLAALALCDHDTVDGLPEFGAAGAELGFAAIGGVELSLEFVGTTHLLGLGVKARGGLPPTLEAVKGFRLERNLRLHERLAQVGVKIDWGRLLELSRGGQMGRPHFARAMCEAGYCRGLDEAFDRYLGKGRPAYVNKIRPSPEKALGLLRASGFAPVLAHPVSLGLSISEMGAFLPQWREWGLVGLEAFHPDQTVDFGRQVQGLCRRHGLVATAGSDFHGANKRTPLSWVRDHSPLGLEVLAALAAAL
jgi:predicted metal-dependent phosphoesterase TrpH